MDSIPEPKHPPEPCYFVVTLDEAQRINAANPHGISTINQLLDERAASAQDLPAVGMPVPGPDDSGWGSVVYTFRDLFNISHTLAHHLVGTGVLPAVSDECAPPPTAAILAPSSTQLLMTFLALVRIGYSVLLIGPQCTPQAISHLLSTTACTHLFHSAPLAAPLPDSCAVHLVPPIPPSSATAPYPTPRSTTAATTAYIHHTSGTSGLPKAIRHTHAAATSLLPQLRRNQPAALTTTPLYHGGTADLMRALMASAMLWLFPPSAPITNSTILSALAAADAAALPVALFTAVPYVLELCAADPQAVARMAAMHMVGVGGAPLRTAVGDALVRNGVKLVSRFGSSECGFLMSSHRDFATDTAWDYLRVSPACTHLQFIPSDTAPTLELLVLASWPQPAPGSHAGAYATGDLFTAHATQRGAYRFAGRRDATLVLGNGRKVDAAGIEAAFVARGAGSAAVAFGRGRGWAGVLLFGGAEEAVAAAAAARECGVLPEMVVRVAGEAPRSSKGVVMRGEAEARWAVEIEAAYRRVEEGAGAETEEAGGGAEWVGRVVREMVGPVRDAEDLFAAGVDSVMAARIRGRLIKGLRAGTTLPRNVVFEQRTIDGLRRFIDSGGGGEAGNMQPPPQQTDLMRSLVEKYSDFPSLEERPLAGPADGHVVVLTGATGAFGAHLLHQLRGRAGVTRVICLCRAKDHAHAQLRVAESLRIRKLPASTGGVDVTAYAAALGERDLGLGAALYSQLSDEASVIIHAAWAVNFAASLESFEKDHIAGTQNLAHLALRSARGCRLYFCSSTAAVLGDGGPGRSTGISETFADDPRASAPLGYARSKWVAEQICRRLPGRAAVLRIGQLCADTVHGVWNETEAWPLMFASVNVVRCLPELNEKLSWLPVDVAGQAVLDIALHEHPRGLPTEPVFHVANTDTSTSWGLVLDWILQRGDVVFERVAPSVWVKRLADTEDDAVENPSRKLLGLWEANYGEGADCGGRADYRFEVANTLALSNALGCGEGWKLSREYVQNIWNSWVQSGFIKM